MKNYSLKLSLILSWCLWILTACQPSSISGSITTAETNIPVQTEVSNPSRVVEIPTLTPTTTPEETKLLTSTSIPIATQTIDPTTITTASPQPQYSQGEALATLKMLYETNRDCLLPCWWGFMPGQTDWKTAEKFLSPIANAIYEPNEPPETLPWSVEVHLPNTTSTTNTPMVHNYLIEQNILQAFEIWMSKPYSLFSPVSVLNTYGIPDEIYLRTGQSETGYRITFYYSQLGFRIRYRIEGGTNENGVISACYKDEEFVELTIWSQEKELSFIETYELFHREENGEYQLPLDVATGMDVPTFSETFSDPDVPICLETPTDIWPGY